MSETIRHGALAILGQAARIQARQATNFAQLAAASKVHIRAPDTPSPAYDGLLSGLLIRCGRNPERLDAVLAELRADALRECGRDVAQSARAAGL